MLGEIRAQLQALQVRPPGRVLLKLTEGTAAAEKMVANTLAFLAGTVLAEVEGDVRSWGLNLAALGRETLYQLQDGVTTELRAREGRALRTLMEHKANLV